ncbi:MAG TPA: ABC transporter ATP-binding protein [Bacteroidales bacterium]|nr:ABC transporter ATP-binding protein [Bacteroidales bacterium]
METTVFIEAQGLVKNYKGIQAVYGLSFTVFKGDIFGFLGPNGAGKSTTIRMILSLIRQDEGDINIFGLPLSRNRKRILSGIGALVEEPRLFEYMSAYGNLELLGRLSGKKISHSRIMDVLALTGLEERWNSPVRSFSHGMKQRLGIAQAIVHDPELLILDEPANGLDPKGMKDMREIIVRLNREFGKTIFISSHILKDIELMANRMLIIDHGAKVVEGNVQELLNAAESNLRITVSEPERAVAVLKEKPETMDLMIDHEGNIVMKANRELVPDINKLLVDNGLKVYSLMPVNSLEQYFLDKT